MKISLNFKISIVGESTICYSSSNRRLEKDLSSLWHKRQVIEIDKQAVNIADISVIVNNAVQDIFKKVAGMPVQSVSCQDMSEGDLWSLVITTQGDYHMTVILCANYGTLCSIAQNMRHGMPASDSDVPIYITEFFNILCGRVVSAINMKTHSTARFGIPRLNKGVCISGMDEEDEMCRKEYFYQCGDDLFRMETVLNNCRIASV